MFKIVDMNYPNREQIPVYVEDERAEPLSVFFGSDLYREIRKNDLTLLSSDINEVRYAVNNYIETSFSMQARTDIEIPRLEAIGREVIDLINTEYGQK